MTALQVFLLVLCAGAGSPALARSYFDATQVRSADLKPFPKWTGVLARYFDEAKLATGSCVSRKFSLCHLKEWEAFLNTLRSRSLEAQVAEINRFHNKKRYILDPVNWGKPDYWATPREFNRKNGDCEDYAIAKYISLRALGVPDERMRVVIVQDFNLGGIIHSILLVKLDDKEVILDNQVPQVVETRRLRHYKPIYSINETAWWRYRY